MIDINEDPIPVKKVKPEKVGHCRSQASISSIMPSAVFLEASMPTDNSLPEPKSSHGGSWFTNNDLPVILLSNRKWLKKVLLTLLLWLGDQPNVWSVPERDLILALQEIIKVIIPEFTDLQDIHPNMLIFCLVTLSFLILDITILTTM